MRMENEDGESGWKMMRESVNLENDYRK